MNWFLYHSHGYFSSDPDPHSPGSLHIHFTTCRSSSAEAEFSTDSLTHDRFHGSGM